MSVDDELLGTLAERAGLSTRWEDAFGKVHAVSPDNLQAVLGALGFEARSDGDARGLIDALEREDAALAPRVTGDAGGELVLPVRPGAWRMQDEGGGVSSGTATARDGGACVALPSEPGYYRLEIDGRETGVAVAPARCFGIADAFAAPGLERGHAPRGWGLAQQLYALRRPGDGGVGDFAALAEFVREAAAHGASAVSISPVHAQFSADPDRFSPYAPSSRIKLESHALFEALHAHLWREGGGAWHWKDWPEPFRDPHAAGAAAFAAAHPDEVTFHAWLQHRADRELGMAQKAASDAGMAIGLVSDLAVGTDSGGSHCWSRQKETLIGLTVGAPPDLLQRNGQNWGITAFSGRGLRANGFRAFIEMLEGAMRHAGGVRIDHAMGLNRLWVVPEGRSAADGAYLRLPEADLIRLTRLESVRNRAIVLGEDLGTVPDGFQDRLQAAGIDGMRVLWFERDEKGFNSPGGWTRQASAMTSTHDLPTVAGWWKGHDVATRRVLGGTEADEQRELAERATARTELWAAMQASGAASGPMPAVWDTVPVVDAAVAQVGGSACELAMVPTEDALGLEEQPNVPGTVSEQPNWRRRLHDPVGTVLSGERTTLRLRRLEQQRRG